MGRQPDRAPLYVIYGLRRILSSNVTHTLLPTPWKPRVSLPCIKPHARGQNSAFILTERALKAHF
jgi:hypothetical protein